MCCYAQGETFCGSPAARDRCDVFALPMLYAEEVGPATRYTLWCNTTSMWKIVFFFFLFEYSVRSAQLWLLSAYSKGAILTCFRSATSHAVVCAKYINFVIKAFFFCFFFVGQKN